MSQVLSNTQPAPVGAGRGTPTTRTLIATLFDVVQQLDDWNRHPTHRKLGAMDDAGARDPDHYKEQAMPSSQHSIPRFVANFARFPNAGSGVRKLTRPFAILFSLVIMLATAAPASAQIYHAREMNKAQFAALDKAKTVVMLVGGNFEEHGPYIPADTDGIVAERLANDLADALVAKGWAVLIFPEIPLGSSPVNELAGIYPYPGSYNVRFTTIRTVYMDLATEFGIAGYKWVFMMHTHGAPNFVRAQMEAGAYFDDHYNGRMLRITGDGPKIQSGPNPYGTLSAAAQKADAHSGHGGINETSLMLYVRPDLVDPKYKDAPAFPATQANGGMIGVSKQKNWMGYFGAPSYSTAEYGAKLYHWTLNRYIQQAENVLNGKTELPQHGRALRNVDTAAFQRDAHIGQQEEAWIKKNVGQ